MLGAAILLGILPVVLMGRTIGNQESGSRVLLPVLPVAACLTAYLLLCALPRRGGWILIASCGFLAGYFITHDSLSRIAERKQVSRWAATLEEFVPDRPGGMCIAVFDPDGFEPETEALDYELTARLIQRWPKAKQDHFWATVRWRRGWPWSDTPEASDMAEVFARLQNFHHGRLSTIHNGTVEQILWVHIKDDGSLEIRRQRSPSAKPTVP